MAPNESAKGRLAASRQRRRAPSRWPPPASCCRFCNAARSARRRVRPALADDRIALDELRGTPVVLNFWAFWCIPCREEAPTRERAWRRVRARGVVFLGLNMQDLTDDARAFMREFDNT